MTTPEKSVKDIVDEVMLEIPCQEEHYGDGFVWTGVEHPDTGQKEIVKCFYCHNTREVLTQTLKAERQKREEAVDEEREKLRVHIEREVIDPLIDTSKKHFGIKEAIYNLREALTQPNNHEK